MAPSDLDDFEIRGFVDWVQLDLTLASTTQARYLRSALPAGWAHKGNMPYVEAVSGAASTTDTVFRVRVQDPENVISIARDLRRLSEQFPFAQPAAVTGVEVGIDAWPRGPEASVVDMAEHLHRALSCPVSDNRRITAAKATRGGVQSAVLHRSDTRRALSQQLTIFIGDVGDPVTQRVYAKDLKRARYEVTLTGDECPFHTVDQWAGFDFAKLSHLFRWRRSVTEPQTLRATLLNWQPALTRPGHAELRARHRRLHRHGTAADVQLQGEVLKALRRLSTSQRRGWKPAMTDRPSCPDLQAASTQAATATPADASPPNSTSAGILTICSTQVVDSSEFYPFVLNTSLAQEHGAACLRDNDDQLDMNATRRPLATETPSMQLVSPLSMASVEQVPRKPGGCVDQVESLHRRLDHPEQQTLTPLWVSRSQ